MSPAHGIYLSQRMRQRAASAASHSVSVAQSYGHTMERATTARKAAAARIPIRVMARPFLIEPGIGEGFNPGRAEGFRIGVGVGLLPLMGLIEIRNPKHRAAADGLAE